MSESPDDPVGTTNGIQAAFDFLQAASKDQHGFTSCFQAKGHHDGIALNTGLQTGRSSIQMQSQRNGLECQKSSAKLSKSPAMLMQTTCMTIWPTDQSLASFFSSTTLPLGGFPSARRLLRLPLMARSLWLPGWPSISSSRWPTASDLWVCLLMDLLFSWETTRVWFWTPLSLLPFLRRSTMLLPSIAFVKPSLPEFAILSTSLHQKTMQISWPRASARRTSIFCLARCFSECLLPLVLLTERDLLFRIKNTRNLGFRNSSSTCMLHVLGRKLPERKKSLIPFVAQGYEWRGVTKRNAPLWRSSSPGRQQMTDDGPGHVSMTCGNILLHKVLVCPLGLLC